MEFTQYVEQLRAGQQVQFPPKAHTLDYARSLDAQDPIKLRDQYIIPTQASLKKKALDGKIPCKGHLASLLVSINRSLAHMTKQLLPMATPTA